MKIILSNRASVELTEDILTLEELINYVERFKEIASLTSKSDIDWLKNQNKIQKVMDKVVVSVEEEIYDLKKKGEEFSDIAKKFKISTSEARRLYTRMYQRNWMRDHRPSKNKTKVKAKVEKRKRASARVRWTDRSEVLELVKLHYFGTKAQKEQFAGKKRVEWHNISKAIIGLIKRYSIKPAEIGIAKWGKNRGKGKAQIPQVVVNETETEIRGVNQIPEEHFVSMAEKQFVEFFKNHSEKGRSEDDPEFKQAIFLLKEWLKSQGKAGHSKDIQDFFIKTFGRHLVSQTKLKEWFKEN